MKPTLSLFPTAILEPEIMHAIRTRQALDKPARSRRNGLSRRTLGASLLKCTDVPARFGLHQETKKNG
jgi:hypothetical protein